MPEGSARRERHNNFRSKTEHLRQLNDEERLDFLVKFVESRGLIELKKCMVTEVREGASNVMHVRDLSCILMWSKALETMG